MNTRSPCRANGAEKVSPGQRPGYRAQLSTSALKGRRGFPRPFKAHNNPLIPKPRGLPWATMRGRFQPRNLSSGNLILIQQDVDGAQDFGRLPILGTHDLACEAALAIDQIRFGIHGRAVIRGGFFGGIAVGREDHVIVS